MSCPIAEAIRDPLTYWKNQPRYTGPSIEEIISKKLPDSKVLCRATGTPDWHRFMHEHGLKSDSYALYNQVMVEFEESIACLK